MTTDGAASNPPSPSGEGTGVGKVAAGSTGPTPTPPLQGRGFDKGWRADSPRLQGRGKEWGLSAEQLAELHKRARAMRNNPTEPEKRLWRHLSNARLHGFKFRRQEVIGRAIGDFFCPSAKLIVEVDGDTHADPARDQRRDAYLSGLGYAVLHVTNPDVMLNVDGVLQIILRALGVDDSPHPNPSPEGEGLSSDAREERWPANI